MADDPRADALRQAERRLQAAQLTSDVAALDRLLDDRLLFTFGPDGSVHTKADDLAAHRSGGLAMTGVVEDELRVLVDGRTGVTWFLGTVAGTAGGTPFTQRVRYTRTWIHTDEHGWRILAAHVSEV